MQFFEFLLFYFTLLFQLFKFVLLTYLQPHWEGKKKEKRRPGNNVELTHVGAINVPPQKCRLFFWSEAIQGHAPGLATAPLTIRPCWTFGLPHPFIFWQWSQVFPQWYFEKWSAQNPRCFHCRQLAPGCISSHESE